MSTYTTLALDISTSCTGISLMSSDGRLLEVSHVTFDRAKEANPDTRFLIKADLFRDHIRGYKDMGVEKIFIEEPLFASNNAFTVNVLMKFNGICSYIVYSEFGILPTFISVHDVRKTVCPEFMNYTKPKPTWSFPKTKDKKEYIFEKVSGWYPGIEWVMNKRGNLAKENYDMSDSVAVNIAGNLLDGSIEYKQLGS